MAVNLAVPDTRALAPVAGAELGIARAHIRKPDRKDLLLVRLREGTTASGVFTRNRLCAAPVSVAREHLAAHAGSIRALVVNTGCANAGTGAQGSRMRVRCALPWPPRSAARARRCCPSRPV